ncbi:MAG: 3-dehydroquinate synthase family protein [Archangium sp.]
MNHIKPARTRTLTLDALPDVKGERLVIADERVIKLHPRLKAIHGHWLTLRAGESVKSLRTLERCMSEVAHLPRGLTLIAIGGGTIGDFATVFAHVFKRGVAKLIHVPTTLLAAVDSSVGGKGAVNVGGTKNLAGVFHGADETWLIPELFTTLTEAQRREGRIEAIKMVVTLDAKRWSKWQRELPDDLEVIRVGRALKEAVVAKDPFETKGLRAVLNFGHTMGHVIESLSKYRVRHGEAVGLGMLYALDEGVRRRVTPRELATEVEAVIPVKRAQLEKWITPANAPRIRELLARDKKAAWILLVRPGLTRRVAF